MYSYHTGIFYKNTSMNNEMNMNTLHVDNEATARTGGESEWMTLLSICLLCYSIGNNVCFSELGTLWKILAISPYIFFRLDIV